MDPERFQSVFTATAHVSIEPDPETYRQATTGPHNEEWKKVVLEEYASLCAREVFDLQRLPNGKKAIPVKWLFKTKFDKEGQVSRYKARLVVKGFHQKKGIDFNEVFAPTVKFSTIRPIFSIAISNGLLYIEQVDIDTTFLNAILREEIYVEQPEGFVVYATDGEKLVWRLQRDLYGIKQAPLEWCECYHKTMKKLGLKPLISDPSAYFYKDEKTLCVL